MNIQSISLDKTINSSSQKIIFLNSHPIQYFAPLYQYLHQCPGMSCSAIYCSKHGLKGEQDEQFGVAVQWDLPILEGYPSVFLKNYSLKPSIYHFTGLMNWGVVSHLLRQPRSIVIVHGWNYFTHCLTLIAARLAGHVVCLRAETPANQELLRSSRIRNMRKLFFRFFLKPMVHFFLPIGQQNQLFYQLYGVPEHKLLHLPYAVDNVRFQKEANQYTTIRNTLCSELGIDPQRRIFVWVGKYISKKRPLDVLAALASMTQRQNAALIMVGEGELRLEMEALIAAEQLEQVVLSGFVNQGKISQYYACANVLVMSSESGETWGLVANEAANFSLPLLVSNRVGCAVDLVQEGENGFVYPCGNIDQLSRLMDQLAILPTERLQQMGQKSLERIAHYSFEVLATQLRKIPL